MVPYVLEEGVNVKKSMNNLYKVSLDFSLKVLLQIITKQITQRINSYFKGGKDMMKNSLQAKELAVILSVSKSKQDK